MSMTTTARDPVLTGGCQCGAIRYALYAEPTGVSICHCRMCQKAVGNYFAAFAGVKHNDFAWTRGKPGAFRSSEIIERDFCRDCGTPLTYRALDKDRISVSVGSLDQPDRVHPDKQYGIESTVARLSSTWHRCRAEQPTPGPASASASSPPRQHPDHETTDWKPPTGGASE